MTLPQEVQDKVASLKSQGYVVQAITIAGTKYVYKSVNRAEFRALQEKLTREAEEAKKNLPEDKLEQEALAIRDRGEERLVEVGLIHPPLSANTPAGVLTSIADYIMQASGFGIETEPETL